MWHHIPDPLGFHSDIWNQDHHWQHLNIIIEINLEYLEIKNTEKICLPSNVITIGLFSAFQVLKIKTAFGDAEAVVLVVVVAVIEVVFLITNERS